MKNWKTTTIGILTIASSVVAGALAFLKGDQASGLLTLITALGGVGHIAASDASAPAGAPGAPRQG